MRENETTDDINGPAHPLQENLQQVGYQSRLLMDLAKHHAEGISKTHFKLWQNHLNNFNKLLPSLYNKNSVDDFSDYLSDYLQRWALFLDTLRKRGNSYIEREKEGFKPVLFFDYELLIDGRTLEKPVNYSLVRIQPPDDYPPQRENGRPFVIIDPRAGHGSGIGGYKAQSEVGVALKDGHPVYFVIFHPEPEPSQTLAHICQAEAQFLKEVNKRHPNSPSPLVIGNCQGGWASMILSATHPDLTGPVVIAGAPLSYWAGEVGKNPFRYFGGLAGGAVPALMAADFGKGKFDGAGLVLNFEQLNPGKTWWRKYYDVFAHVDQRSDEFLKFEDWWSGFYFMNENEIRWIVENLFIGNKLTRGEAILSDGTPIDLTRIKAPVVVFASHGDNITPPQQALNWIADLHETVEEIKARGHVIIYTLHDSVGHLGIFVSAKVASKQHKQITSVVKTIEALAPGLYEMKIEDNEGVYEVSFEGRTIDDILALDDGREEEQEFAAVAKFSEWATKTYELTMRPAIQCMITPEIAETLVKLHPMRQQRYMFSDQNPFMAKIEGMAEEVRSKRKKISDDNPFLKFEQMQADLIEQSFDFYRDTRDAMIEFTFHSLYGTSWMKAIANNQQPSLISHDVMQFPEVKQSLEHVELGGYREAIVRMLILLAQARGAVRRDRLEKANKLLHSRPPFDTMSEEERSKLIYEQSLIVQFAPNEAIMSLRKLLKDEVDRLRAVNLVFDVAGPVDEMDPHTIAMFKRIQSVLLTMPQGWHEPKYDVSAHELGTSPKVRENKNQRPATSIASKIETSEEIEDKIMPHKVSDIDQAVDKKEASQEVNEAHSTSKDQSLSTSK